MTNVTAQTTLGDIKKQFIKDMDEEFKLKIKLE